MKSEQFERELSPLWAGECVYRETVMFIGKEDRAPLLYVPTEILSVTSYDGAILYREGEDYVCSADGMLSLCENSQIPYIEEEAFYHDDPSSLISVPYKGKETFIYWGEGTTMTRWQIAVTYRHASTPILPPDRYENRFADFLSKMERGEDVTVLFYGDSITRGANSSYACETPPFLPPWSMLCSEYLARRYEFREHFVDTGLEWALPVPQEDLTFGDRGTLSFINTAVSGWTSGQGLENLQERILNQIETHGCDLMVFAFGMNDKRITVEEHVANMRAMVEQVVRVTPQASVLLVVPMYANPASTRWCTVQPLFEEADKVLAEEYTRQGTPCAVVPMTTMSARVLARKRFCDYSGNNINHPNDFMMRLYARTTLYTLLGE